MSERGTVRERIRARRQEQGHLPFLVAPEAGLEITYADLALRCEAIDAALGRLDVGTGGKVAFLLDNGPWTVTLFLGTM